MKKTISLFVILTLIYCSNQKSDKNMFGIFKSKTELSRKERSEKIIKEKGIKINYQLPDIESEEDTEIRSAKEIAKRVTVLAVTNMVAFDEMTNKDAIEYLKKYNLWNEVTPNEKEFLNNPNDKWKIQVSWETEKIWTLLWAIKKIDLLGFPNEMCDLNKVSSHNYPIDGKNDPNIFIKSVKEVRSKSEILDANDLHYRINWACVNARINNLKINQVNLGIVYERHYTLNWLMNYINADWDDITCDT